MPVHVKVASAAKDVLADESLGIGILDRLLHDDRKVAVFATDVDVSAFRPDRESGNHHTFDHRVRIVLEDQAVFASAGLTFVAVAKNVLRLGRLFGNKRPLYPSGEARAAAPAEAGRLHLVDNGI